MTDDDKAVFIDFVETVLKMRHALERCKTHAEAWVDVNPSCRILADLILEEVKAALPPKGKSE